MGQAQEGLSLASLARDGKLILHVHHIGPKDSPEGWGDSFPVLPSKAALPKLLAPRCVWRGSGQGVGTTKVLLILCHCEGPGTTPADLHCPLSLAFSVQKSGNTVPS